MSDGLRINVDTPIDAVARRALTRHVGQRFDPLVVTDNAGRYVGVVRMERIVHQLSSQPQAASAIGSQAAA